MVDLHHHLQQGKEITQGSCDGHVTCHTSRSSLGFSLVSLLRMGPRMCRISNSCHSVVSTGRTAVSSHLQAHKQTNKQRWHWLAATLSGDGLWQVEKKAHVTVHEVGVHERDQTAATTCLPVQHMHRLQQVPRLLLTMLTQHLQHRLVEHAIEGVLGEEGSIPGL